MKYGIATILLLISLAVGQHSSALPLKTSIPLPNVQGRLDHFGVDLKGQRLFMAAVANHTLEVFQQRDARYPTPPGTQTGLFVPERGTLFAGVQGRGAQQPSGILVYAAK